MRLTVVLLDNHTRQIVIFETSASKGTNVVTPWAKHNLFATESSVFKEPCLITASNIQGTYLIIADSLSDNIYIVTAQSKFT